MPGRDTTAAAAAMPTKTFAPVVGVLGRFGSRGGVVVIVGVNDSDEFWNDLTIRIELQAIFEVLFSIVFTRKLTSRYGKICTSFNYNIAINGASFNFCRKLLTRLILNRRIKYISNLSVNHYAIAINYSFYRIVTAFSTPNCYALIFQ